MKEERERERQKEEREKGQEKRREKKEGGEAGRPNDCTVETGKLYYTLGSYPLLAALLGVSRDPGSFAQC